MNQSVAYELAVAAAQRAQDMLDGLRSVQRSISSEARATTAAGYALLSSAWIGIALVGDVVDVEQEDADDEPLTVVSLVDAAQHLAPLRDPLS